MEPRLRLIEAGGAEGAGKDEGPEGGYVTALQVRKRDLVADGSIC